jgi:hypothetical protein
MNTLSHDAEALERLAKFPKGQHADPTTNMSPEQKAEWEAMNKEHGDKFKMAGKFPEALFLYEDRLEKMIRFYPNWVAETADIFAWYPTRPGQLSTASSGLYQSVVGVRDLMKRDRYDALVAAVPTAGRLLILALKAAAKVTNACDDLQMQYGEGAPAALKLVQRHLRAYNKIVEPFFQATGLSKTANGDMLQYFADHPDKLAEKKMRDKDKKALDELALMNMDLVEGSISHVAIDRDLTALEQHGRMAAIDVAASSQIGKTIIDQMGGMRAMRMIGAKQIIWLPKGVRVMWPNKQRSKGNCFEVTLNSMDTYDLEFFNVSIKAKKSVKKFRGVYFDQLGELFEKQTGWYLRMASDQRELVAASGYLLSIAPDGTPRVDGYSDEVLFSMVIAKVLRVQPSQVKPNGRQVNINGKRMSWQEALQATYQIYAGESFTGEYALPVGRAVLVNVKVDSIYEKGMKAAKGDEKDSKFEEGESADPTENMSEEDAKKWRLENLKNKDKFTDKKAATEKVKLPVNAPSGAMREKVNKALKALGITVKWGDKEAVLSGPANVLSMVVPLVKGKKAADDPLATWDSGSRVPDGWDSGKIEGDEEATKSDSGSDTPDGQGNSDKRAARPVRVGPKGVYRHRWPFVYAHGKAEDLLGFDVVSFDAPPQQGRLDAVLTMPDGTDHPAFIFSWTSQGMPGGLVVLKSDRQSMGDAVREMAKGGKVARGNSVVIGWSYGGDIQVWRDKPGGRRVEGDTSSRKKLSILLGKVIGGGTEPPATVLKEIMTKATVYPVTQVSFEGQKWVVTPRGKQARSGLYGFTKRIQADCETSVRKIQKAAANVARRAYTKSPKVAEFLSTHASRSDSLPAHILVAALGEIGPKVAAEMSKQARLEELRAARGFVAEDKTAAPRGKAQLAIAAHISGWKTGQSAALPEISKVTTLRGVHFAKIMSAAEALAKQGLIDFDGVKVTKKAKLTDADAQDGTKQTSDKTAGSGSVNARYLASIPAPKKAAILKAVAKHYAVSVREIESELTDRDAEELYEYLAFDNRMAMEVYREFQNGRFASDKTAGHHFDGKDWYGDTAFINAVQHAYPGATLSHIGFGEFVLKTPDGEMEFDRMRGVNFEGQSGRSHKLYDNARGKVVDKAIKLMEQKGKSERRASDKTAARKYGLYGFGDKVASLGLSACSDVRAEAGRIASGLHGRRSAKHRQITAFLDTHCKTAECRYSKLLHSSYPDEGSKMAAAAPPRTVQAWLDVDLDD